MDFGSPSIAELQPGTFIAGRYEVQCRLGNGGMGVVFKAVDKELEDTVAIKLLHPHLAQDETVYRRFRNEVLVARALTHPNIVRTHDMGRAEGGYSYISMEYIGGKSLRELLNEEFDQYKRGFTLEYAVEVLYDILSGVSYAHGKGIIHRDLKPANVLLSETGEVKLADFGTARILGMDTTITRMGQVVGTPDYMSPEQIRGEELSPSCDIYSLGIIAYELVTAQRPFFADTPVAVAFKHLNDPIPDIDPKLAIVPSWYMALIRKAAAKKIEDRYSSVSEMAKVLVERCPHLGQRSGFFPGESSQFVTGASAKDAGSTDPSADTLANNAPKKFELGQLQTSSAPSGWTLSAESPYVESATAGPSSTPVTEPPPAVAKKTRSKAPMLTALALAVLIPLAAIASVRSSPTLQAVVAEMLVDLPADSGLRNSLATVFNSPQMAVVEQIAQPVDVTPDDRDELQDELLAFVGEPSAEAGLPTPTEEAAKGIPPETTTGAAVATTAVVPTPTEVDKAEPVQKTDVSAQGSSEESGASTTGEGATNPTPAPPEKVKPDTGVLEFRKGSSAFTETMVKVSDLSAMRWQARFPGVSVPSAQSERKSMLAEVKLNVFDPRTAQVVATQPATSVRSEADAFTVDGRFTEIARKVTSVGNFRIDLVYAGEVLSSREISLYKAGVSPVQPTSVAAGGAVGGNVAIIRGAAVVEPATSTTPAKVVTPPPTEQVASQPLRSEPTIEPTPTTQPSSAQTSQVEDRRVFLRERSGGRVAAPYTAGGENIGDTSVGLPPARGITNPSTVAATTPPVVDTSVIDSAPQTPPAISENYTGTFRIAVGTQPEQPREFVLNLEITGVSIRGSATISGFDRFSVSGKVLLRGVELLLQNSQYSITLAGSRSSTAMRGRYQFPALNQRGQWQVVKAN